MATTIYEDLSIEDKKVIDDFESLVIQSGLTEILEFRNKYKDRPLKNLFSLRFSSNPYRIGSVEIYKNPEKRDARIFFHDSIYQTSFYEGLKAIGKTEIPYTSKNIIDYKFSNGYGMSDFLKDLTFFLKNNQDELPAITSRSVGFEGLNLPIIDTDEPYQKGMTFTWKEILAIIQEPESELFKSLSKSGVYLQRSKNGVSRYIGSAYGDGGIISRWRKHLERGGDAKFLSWYVLENGYGSIEFTVLEFCEDSEDSVIQQETYWKNTLATKTGIYNGYQLNNN